MANTTNPPDTPELSRAFFQYGVTPALLHGVTDEELEATYQLAYELVMEGRYEKALEYAELLVRMDPAEQRYLFAFALCLHHVGEYASAARYYAEALVLKATDAVCAFRMGECLMAMQDLDNARTAFELCVTLSWLEADWAEVRGLAQQHLDELFGEGA